MPLTRIQEAIDSGSSVFWLNWFLLKYSLNVSHGAKVLVQTFGFVETSFPWRSYSDNLPSQNQPNSQPTRDWAINHNSQHVEHLGRESVALINKTCAFWTCLQLWGIIPILGLTGMDQASSSDTEPAVWKLRSTLFLIYIWALPLRLASWLLFYSWYNL